MGDERMRVATRIENACDQRIEDLLTPLWDRPGAMDLIKQDLGVLHPLLKSVTRGDAAIRALPAPRSQISVTVGDEPEVTEPARLGNAAPTLEYGQRIGQARRMVGDNSKQVAQVVMN